MEYKKEQLTTLSRHINFIEIAKVKEIDGNDLILERFNGQTERFPTSCIGDYAPNQCVDIQYFNTGSNSHTLRLLGHTPQEFIKSNTIGKDECNNE